MAYLTDFKPELPGADLASCRSASVGGTGREKRNTRVKHQGEENLKAGFTFIYKLQGKKTRLPCSRKNQSDLRNKTKAKAHQLHPGCPEQRRGWAWRSAGSSWWSGVFTPRGSQLWQQRAERLLYTSRNSNSCVLCFWVIVLLLGSNSLFFIISCWRI